MTRDVAAVPLMPRRFTPANSAPKRRPGSDGGDMTLSSCEPKYRELRGMRGGHSRYRELRDVIITTGVGSSSTVDCKFIYLQPAGGFWQNEPKMGDFSRPANDLAIFRATSMTPKLGMQLLIQPLDDGARRSSRRFGLMSASAGCGHAPARPSSQMAQNDRPMAASCQLRWARDCSRRTTRPIAAALNCSKPVVGLPP
jgi:hypothetical protein